MVSWHYRMINFALKLVDRLHWWAICSGLDYPHSAVSWELDGHPPPVPVLWSGYLWLCGCRLLVTGRIRDMLSESHVSDITDALIVLLEAHRLNRITLAMLSASMLWYNFLFCWRKICGKAPGRAFKGAKQLLHDAAQSDFAQLGVFSAWASSFPKMWLYIAPEFFMTHEFYLIC